MDLLDSASVRPAVEGVHGVFHLASPVILQPTQDPENELLLPAVNGALNVLRAAKDGGVKRVVMVSSQTAMCPNPDWPADKVIDDDSWADLEILKKLELWYNVSKTLAEKAAWDLAGEEGLELVVLNPGLVLGPTLTPAATASLRLLMMLLEGQKLDIEPFFFGCVDVRDVAESLVVLYENPSAQGRHLCMESAVRLVDFHHELANLYPEFPVHRIQEDKQGWLGHGGLLEEQRRNLACEFLKPGLSEMDRFRPRWTDCIEHLALTQKWGAWQSCFHETGLPSQPVIDCYNSGYGRQLELRYAAETNALQPPHQFVPWVVVNGRPLGYDYKNFEAYICNAYDGEIPEACRGKHLQIAQHTRASRGHKRNPRELALLLAFCIALWF